MAQWGDGAGLNWEVCESRKSWEPKFVTKYTADALGFPLNRSFRYDAGVRFPSQTNSSVCRHTLRRASAPYSLPNLNSIFGAKAHGIAPILEAMPKSP